MTAALGTIHHKPSLHWERVPCPLCAARNEEVVLTRVSQPDGNHIRLVKCGSCGLGYVNPRPDPASIGQFYPQDYDPYQPPAKQKNSSWHQWRNRIEQHILERDLGYPTQTQVTWWERLAARLLSKRLGPGRDSITALPWQGEGRLLDFGCGSGWFAERMRRHGWEVEGIDFSEHAAQQARQAFNLRVHVGSLPHADVAPNSFDVINMGSVLEHVHHPHAIIAEAAKVLRPGGLLAISVPNFGSWGVRKYGANSYLIDLPRHLLHFTPETTTRLLESHGLRVREVRMLNRASWMRRTLRNVWRDRGESWSRRWFARLAKLRLPCSLLTRWTVWKGRSDFFLTFAEKV